jgi:hypothetical protein
MADKLNSRQHATLAVLDTFPPKFDQIHRLIEELATLRADENQARRLARVLDEMKAAAAGVGEGAIADNCGTMGMMARRTGGLQTRVRGLRDSFMGLKTNFEGARKRASTPDSELAQDGETR